MSQFKKFILLFILIVIGLGTIVFSLIRMPQKNLHKNLYRAQVHPFSIVFYTNEEEELFKVSPLDDYFYKAQTKNHLTKDSDFRQNTNLIEEFKIILQRIFSNAEKLTWAITKGKTKIKYEVKDKKNGIVQIERSLENFPPEINAVGQSIVICSECLVVNQDKTLVYFREDQLISEKLEKSDELGLIPLIVDEQLPVDTLKLLIIGSAGEKKFEVEVAPGQEVYFSQELNILELKTLIDNKKAVNISQIIKFY